VFALAQAFEQGNAVETKVEQTLKLVSQAATTAADTLFPAVKQRRRIFFDHSEFVIDAPADAVKGATDSLSFLCQGNVQEEVHRLT
jgi:hypothetical protein